MHRLPTLLFTCLLLTISSGTSAQSETGITPWFAVSGGFTTYAMGDVNEEIRALDNLLYAKFNEIKMGLGYVVKAGIDLNQRYRFSAQIHRCSALSDVHDNTGSLEYRFPANAYFLSVTRLPPATSPVLVGIGLSGGIIKEDGTITLAFVGEGSATRNLTGAGPYIDAHLTFDFILSRGFTLFANSAYRSAKISKVEIGGERVRKEDGSNYSIDYSGFVFQVGLMFRFPKRM
ncbi:hypothetical protein ACFL6R_00725 [Gemmatimonadota bacterium]